MTDNGPDHKKYSYQCSSILPIRAQVLSDEEYNNLKNLECNHFSSIFNEFYINRLFSSYTYTPIICSIVRKINMESMRLFVKKYFYYLNKPDIKMNFDFENSSIDFTKFDKNTVYTVALTESLKNDCDIYIDKDFDGFVKNEYLLKLREHTGALIIFLDSEDPNLAKLFKNNFVRSYSEVIFFDNLNKNLYDIFSYIGCNTNVKINTGDYMMTVDRTEVWTDIKAYKYK